jgi:transcriptional regulator with XRE-family HTH domain
VPKPLVSTGLKKLSRRLRELRLRHGLTQEEYADIAGVSYKFYQQIESGRKKQVWLETVERLAAGYGLEAWEILAPQEPTKVTLAGVRRSSRVHNTKS